MCVFRRETRAATARVSERTKEALAALVFEVRDGFKEAFECCALRGRARA
jgi:hypothetical protein